MFSHITEFFQVHRKKLTLSLTLLSEGSCRDPEDLRPHSLGRDVACSAQHVQEGYFQSGLPIWILMNEKLMG